MILGRRGCGKSTLARGLQSLYPRILRFDTLNEYPESEGDCWDFREFGEKIIAHQHSDKFTLTYRFDPERGANVDEFNQAMRVAWYRGSLLIVVEEIQNFSNAHQLPRWLEQALTTGRHRGLALLFTTQMPRFAHKALISQADHVFCGTLHEKNDLAYAQSIFHEKVEVLPRLPERRFLYFRLGYDIIEVNNSLAGEPASRRK